MFRSMIAVMALLVVPALGQDSGQDKTLDVRSSVGDLHVGADADARKAGLPLYPGARRKSDEPNSNQANLSLLTQAFGMKLIVANYVSEDAPAKVLDFYRDRLKKYGKVLECHSQKHTGSVEMNDTDDDKDSGKEGTKSKELKCEENSGPVTELKVGTEENQHVVAVETGESGKGSKFALVYVHTRGKQGDL